ncbi:hypothetical protein D3C77_533180 [compost metagenome]
MYSLAQCTLRRDLRLGLIQPAFQLGQDRQALFLTSDKPLFIVGVFGFAFDAVQFVDHRQRDISPPGFTLGLHFLRIHELAACMGHACQSLHARL